MAFWSCARIQANREKLAFERLSAAGFEAYFPQMREQRRPYAGRTRQVITPLFPGYAFVLIQLQWFAAHRCVGISGLLLSGEVPAKVPDAVIDSLKARERGGFIELPKAPAFAPAIQFA
jgi:transcriptional antiterminator RfaH